MNDERPHEHEFTAFWWLFGDYGRQDVHVHDCFDRSCQIHLVGEGRSCDGKSESHHRERYGGMRKGWVVA